LRSAAFQRFLCPPSAPPSRPTGEQTRVWNAQLNEALDALPTMGWPRIVSNHAATNDTRRIQEEPNGDTRGAANGGRNDGIGNAEVELEVELEVDCSRWYIEAPSWLRSRSRAEKCALPIGEGPIYAWLAAAELGVSTDATTARLFSALTNSMGCGTAAFLNRVDSVRATLLMHALVGGDSDQELPLGLLLSHPHVQTWLRVPGALTGRGGNRDPKNDPNDREPQNVLDVALFMDHDHGWQFILREITDKSLRTLLTHEDSPTYLLYCMASCPAAFPTLWRRSLEILSERQMQRLYWQELDGATFAALAATDLHIWTLYICTIDHPVHGPNIQDDLVYQLWNFVILADPTSPNNPSSTTSPAAAVAIPPRAQPPRGKPLGSFAGSENVPVLPQESTPQESTPQESTITYVRSGWHRRDPLRSAIENRHESVAVYVAEHCIPNWALDGYDCDGRTVLMRAAAARPPMPRLVEALVRRVPHLDPRMRAISLPDTRKHGLTMADLCTRDCQFGKTALELVPPGREYDLIRALIFAADVPTYLPHAAAIVQAFFRLPPTKATAPTANPADDTLAALIHHGSSTRIDCTTVSSLPAVTSRGSRSEGNGRMRGSKRRRECNDGPVSGPRKADGDLLRRTTSPTPLPLDVARLVFAYTGLPWSTPCLCRVCLPMSIRDD
jgi:hypothetical protein